MSSIVLGTYVRTSLGQTGRVTGIDLVFDGVSDLPFAQDCADERWASLLTHEGGSVYFPFSHLTVIPAFKLENKYSVDYFADDEQPDALDEREAAVEVRENRLDVLERRVERLTTIVNARL